MVIGSRWQCLRFAGCIPPYQRTRRDQPVNLFVFVSPNLNHERGERWLEITSCARTCNVWTYQQDLNKENTNPPRTAISWTNKVTRDLEREKA